METATEGRSEGELDPQAQLEMLEAVQDATEAEAWMPATPVWQAPVLATAIAGIAMVNNGPEGWALTGAVIGGLAALFAAMDQLRRQRVLPRRIRKPLRVLPFYGVIVVVTLGLVDMWGQIDFPASAGRAAGVVFGAWLVTTAVFLLGITATNWMGKRWGVARR